ncbi:MAG: helix-turn-helix domain-containing protein [Bacteroidales bacterium]|nr:helix-turn-helix domain-containing protein [Bacteroidales bacterium]
MLKRLAITVSSLLFSAAVALASGVNPATALYYDGSLWIAGDNGIVRVGRNGRSMNYGEKELGVSGVKGIVADSSENIWYLGSDGLVRSYSFLDGFGSFDVLPSGITALASDPAGERVFASTDTILYSWKPGENEVAECPLESPVTSLDLAADGAVWITCTNAVMRLDKQGKCELFSSASSRQDISNSIHFEIETKAKRINWIAVLFALLVGLTVADAYWRFSIAKPSKQSEPGPAVATDGSTETPAEESRTEPEKTPRREPGKAPQPQPSPTLELSAPDDFVQQVERIIRENIATKKFGVDEIAEITGISRIHVNRKLKAAGCPSPSVMLKKARMKLAEKLVREGKLPMQEIAQRCGFSSASYFATSFRDYFGVPPSDFK